MLHCPACGEGNPDNAKFCKACRSRLEGVHLDLSEGKPIGKAPFPLPTAKAEGLGMSTVSLVLGIFGLGIPAIITGAMALRQGKPHAGQAKAGVLLGSLGTIILAVIIALAATRKDPLSQPLTPETAPTFTSIVTERLDRLDERLAEIVAELGPGGEQEMASVYSIMSDIREELAEIEALAEAGDSEDEELLDSLRTDIVDKLGQADDLLQGQ